MNTYSSDGPLRIGGYRLGVTHLLIVVHCATMVACALLTALLTDADRNRVLQLLIFQSDAVFRGQIWRLVTYIFVNMPSIPFAIEMFMLFWFGRDVERGIGWRAYVGLYLALTLVPSGILTLLGLYQPQGLAGSGEVHFGVFIAFATLYPRAPILFGVLAWVIAAVLLAIYTLQDIAYHSWTALFVLWLNVAVAYYGARWLQAGLEITLWGKVTQLLHRWRMAKQQRGFARRQAAEESVDRILEKISKQGMGSLSAQEKRILENARTRLLRKE